jgi:hypothetical protein
MHTAEAGRNIAECTSEEAHTHIQHRTPHCQALYSGSSASRQIKHPIAAPLQGRERVFCADTQTDMLAGLPASTTCVQRFDDSRVLQFTLRIAFRCVLHRCGSQDILRHEFYIWFIHGFLVVLIRLRGFYNCVPSPEPRSRQHRMLCFHTACFTTPRSASSKERKIGLDSSPELNSP